MGHHGVILADRFSSKEKLAASWTPVRVDIGSPEKSISDFPYLTSGTLICSDRALQVLLPIIADGVEVLPLQASVGSYQAIHVLEVIDCLDHDLSEFERLTSGNILRIVRYAFKPDYLKEKNIFKIPERKGTIFVSDLFKSFVEEQGLLGIVFSKVWEG
jgi:hypothetical protein